MYIIQITYHVYTSLTVQDEDSLVFTEEGLPLKKEEEEEEESLFTKEVLPENKEEGRKWCDIPHDKTNKAL